MKHVPFAYDAEANAVYIELTAGPTDYSIDIEIFNRLGHREDGEVVQVP